MSMKIIRKIVQIISYYMAPILLFLVLYVGIISQKEAYDLSVLMGEWAFILFAIILFIKPLSVLIPKLKILRTIVSLRRELGLLIFWLAFWHSIYLMFALNLFTFNGLIVLTDFRGYLSWGAVAFIGMLIVGITSNKLSAIKLKRNWKKIQMISYPAFIFTAIHRAMDQGDNFSYMIAGVFLILKIVEVIVIEKRKKNNAIEKSKEEKFTEAKHSSEASSEEVNEKTQELNVEREQSNQEH